MYFIKLLRVFITFVLQLTNFNFHCITILDKEHLSTTTEKRGRLSHVYYLYVQKYLQFFVVSSLCVNTLTKQSDAYKRSNEDNGGFR